MIVRAYLQVLAVFFLLVPVGNGAGLQGAEKAFEDLTRYYEKQALPPIREAIENLRHRDPTIGKEAGEYLLSLLWQLQADERSRRDVEVQEMSGTRLSTSSPKDLRGQIAVQLEESADGDCTLDVALWICIEERDWFHVRHGLKILRRIRSPRSVEAFRTVLRGTYLNGKVASEILAEVRERGLKDLLPEVIALTGHHLASVRNTAVETARSLGESSIRDFKLEDAFSPSIAKEIGKTFLMILHPVPPDARFSRLKVTHPPWGYSSREPVEEVAGWILKEGDGFLTFLDLFARESEILKDSCTIVDRSPRDEVAAFLLLRKEKDDSRRDDVARYFSPRGGLTRQFEPKFLSLPEALLGAWGLERGDRKMATEILLPRMDAADDDRSFFEAIRDYLGHRSYHDMLAAYCDRGNRTHALEIARHLSKDLFDGYEYQEVAKELALQIERRREDLVSFRAPTPKAWEKARASMSREEQIRYLAARLRLLHARQMGQPGGVSYSMGSAQAPADRLPEESGDRPPTLINPYEALREMDLGIADIPVLAPFLAEEDFIPTYGYWRNFHPGRTLHRVNMAVARLMNEVAEHDIARLAKFRRLDPEGRNAHIEAIAGWCKGASGKSEAEVLSSVIEMSTDYQDIRRVTRKLLEKGNAGWALKLAARVDAFPSRGAVARMCQEAGGAELVPLARKWITDADEEVRFSGALILLRHGDRAHLEGFDQVKEIIEKDRFGSYHPRAIDDLLGTGDEKARQLAIGILRHRTSHFRPVNDREGVLRKLLAAGSREAMDYVLKELENHEPGGSVSGTQHGESFKYALTRADRMAETIAGWKDGRPARLGNGSFKLAAPEEERAANRKKITAWLQEEFQSVLSGKPSGLQEAGSR